MLKKKRQPQTATRHANQPLTVQEQVRSVPIVSTVLIALLTAVAGAAGVAMWTFFQSRWKTMAEKAEKEEREKQERERLEREARLAAPRQAPPPPPDLRPYDGTYEASHRTAPGRAPAPPPFSHSYSPEQLADWEAGLKAWEARLTERERMAS